MKFIQGQSRDQITLFPTSLDNSISEENEIRVIDVFVNSIDLVKMGDLLTISDELLIF